MAPKKVTRNPEELSAIVPAREKQTIVKTAISKFRAAIQLQFDFHRAIYNLGTVLYELAEDISRTGGHVNAKEVSPDELYSQSAIYIAAAHSLKSNYSVYTSALKLVRSMDVYLEYESKIYDKIINSIYFLPRKEVQAFLK